MAGITLAWLIGEGIIVWRQAGKQHHVPIPGTLLGSSGFFALLALLAEYQPARAAATLTAFGIDVAAYLQVPLVTPAAARTSAAPAPKMATAGPVPRA